MSSKDQESNKSLANQKNSGYDFAKQNSFSITKEFGMTYESASGDFTRKEFMNLISSIKKSRKRPYAILIFTMSRFSRSGGSGIALAHELVDSLGVHLIEVSSGKSTETPQGKNEIYSNLLKANQENLDRLKVTLPGMKDFLRGGNWLGKAPRGYDIYGKRVTRTGYFSETQKVVMNEEGKKIKQAWQWKLQGERDSTIINKLKALGVAITPQNLSDIWRKPFYCGVIANKLVDEPIEAPWEKMVTVKEFWEVQDILAGNKRPKGYVVQKENPKRPLNSFILCRKCEKPMSGYEVEEKGLHYYKCQKCKSSTINADTTRKSKGKGAHQLFEELLSKYQLKDSLVDLYKEQLLCTYYSLNESKKTDNSAAKAELEKLTTQLKKVNKNFAIGELDKSVYLEVKQELEGKIAGLNDILQASDSKISNPEKFVEISVSVVRNINKYWELDNLDIKQKVQEVVFPDGILIDTEKREYLTKKVNSLFMLSAELSRDAEDVNEKTSENISEVSSSVAPSSEKSNLKQSIKRIGALKSVIEVNKLTNKNSIG